MTGNTTEVEVSEMRACAHKDVRRRSVEHGRATRSLDAAGGTCVTPSPLPSIASATALVAEVADLIPAPPAVLGRDDAAWSAFEALLDQAAIALAEAVGPDARPALEAVTASPLDASPVGLLLAERTLGQLAQRAR